MLLLNDFLLVRLVKLALQLEFVFGGWSQMNEIRGAEGAMLVLNTEIVL